MHTAGSSVGDEARQRNGIAVRKMFQRNSGQHSRIEAQIHRGRDARSTEWTTSDRCDGRVASRVSLRVPRTSAAALVGIVGGFEGGERPAWADPDPCGHDKRASLGEFLGLSHQVEQVQSTGTFPSPQKEPMQTRVAPARAGQEDAASRSCFLLETQKSRHARGIMPLPADWALTRHEANKEQLKAYHHQQAVFRYEQTLPRRRALDPYVHLTGAQVGVSLAIPNMYTADRLAERNGGRWVHDNPHRQQLFRGAPVMTRIMRGEYYHCGAERRAAGVPRNDLMAKNRRDVRVASAINQAERQRRQSFSRDCICSKSS